MNRVGAAILQQAIEKYRFIADRKDASNNRGRGFDDGLIDLFDLPVSKLFGKPCRGFGSLGENDDAAYGTVEPMHDADKRVAWFAFAPPAMLGGNFSQAGVARLVGLDEDASRLVDHQQVVVFIEDFERTAHKPAFFPCSAPTFQAVVSRWTSSTRRSIAKGFRK